MSDELDKALDRARERVASFKQESARTGEKVTINGFEMETMESFPAKENPFRHDAFHMGTRMGTNLTIMYANHDTQKCKYLILVDESGRRVRIKLPSSDRLLSAEIENHG